MSAVNLREYVTKRIKKDARIIEFGPLHRPIAKKDQFKNVVYADIRSTQEIVSLYKGNDYLSSTGLNIDTSLIVDIDYIIKKNYKTTFKGVKKFDYAILSHVIEHMPNILYFFEDIESILSDNGRLVLIYPDSRYCFDHYRTEASFRDAYVTYQEGTHNNAKMALDFSLNVMKENRPIFFWNDQRISQKINKGDGAKAAKAYRLVKDGGSLDDVHYWPFSDFGLLRFLREAQNMGYINFEVEHFIPTEPNTQEFLIILKRTPKNTRPRPLSLALLDKTDPVIKISRLEKELTTCQQELATIHRSKTWRCTKPLRATYSLLSKIKHKIIKQ